MGERFSLLTLWQTAVSWKLLAAVKAGCIKEAQDLVEKGCDIFAFDSDSADDVMTVAMQHPEMACALRKSWEKTRSHRGGAEDHAAQIFEDGLKMFPLEEMLVPRIPRSVAQRIRKISQGQREKEGYILQLY